MRYSQRKFYALNLKSVYRIVERNEETSYSILGIDDARTTWYVRQNSINIRSSR